MALHSGTGASRNALLWLVPGAVACAAGALVIVLARGASVNGGGLGMTIAGAVTIACGAWFAIGLAAWPVLQPFPGVLVRAPVRELGGQVGYSPGPSLILVAVGGSIVGWILRGRRSARVR